MSLSSRTLMRCFFRSYMTGAAYNPRGLQNVGFLYAIDPGLTALYRESEGLKKARLRHAKHFNSHPFFTPLLLGAYLRMEEGIEGGRLSPTSFASLKETAANSLSAIGDSFFNGTCLNTWALCSVTLICLGLPAHALALAGALLFGVQVFKLVTFILGWRLGMSVLFLVKRIDLINWGERLKYLNAALLAVFLWFALPDAHGLACVFTAVSLLLLSWFIGKMHINRVVLALGLVLFAVLLHLAGFLDAWPESLFQQTR